MTGKTIGRGTWIDKLASELLEREKSLGRSLDLIKVESGLGASGIPHIGSLGDAVRAYGVKLALENLGYKSELVAYSDDLDGLRKIPAGFSESLSEHIGKPVSDIDDPSGCHDSYGSHMSSLLLDALDKLGITYTHISAKDAYSRGVFEQQTIKILESSARIGEQIEEITGQGKFRTVIPYYPICEQCGKLYTTVVTEYVGDKRLNYKCADASIGGNLIRGCSHEGECDVSKDRGKLAWKVEFAARWAALDVRFEAYGKDIMDSVRVNDWVSENILNHKAPHHVKYEMFLDRTGTKISKSSGNVFTPQMWLRYGTPQSLLLLLFKRITGARKVGIEDVPSLMDELATLELHYFGHATETNPEKATRQKGLYEYVHLLSPPTGFLERAPYSLIVELAQVFDEDRAHHITKTLLNYGTIKSEAGAIPELIILAATFADDFGSPKAPQFDIDDKMKNALTDIADKLDASANTQEAIRAAATDHDIKIRDIFRTLYLVILGVPSGPRLSNFIDDVGSGRIASKIRECL